MSITLKTHKLLWGRSGGKCAICKNDLLVGASHSDDDPSIVGDEAHIIARSRNFTRGDYYALSPAERDHYSNLILLCKTDHKRVDDQPAEFTVDKLREIKAAHENEVRDHWTGVDKQKQRDELVYAGYIDFWEDKSDIDNWRWTSTWLSADSPALQKKWHDEQREFIPWFVARIWPQRHPTLENALINYRVVLEDFLNTFDQHIDHDKHDDDILWTRKFYRLDEWDPERYAKLGRLYNAHICVVSDLFFELTRAANYICDAVRSTIFPGYRMDEGAVLVERNNVGFELKTEVLRLEYRGAERIDRPYPGLADFKAIRYSLRDYALSDKEPDIPDGEA